MKNLLIRYGLITAVLCILAAVVFRGALGADMTFNGSDHGIGRIADNNRMLPERFHAAYQPGPVFGSVGTSPVAPVNVGQWLLPPEQFSDLWYAGYVLVASIALIAYLRLWGIGWLPALFGALASFWVGSITLSAAGHLTKLGVAAMWAISLYLIERALRSESRKMQVIYSAAAGFAAGVMLLEKQDVGLYFAIFLGLYVGLRLLLGKERSPLKWAAVLLPVLLVVPALVLPTARQAYEKNIQDVNLDADPKQKWEFVTQWSMVPAEWPDLIAPGYTGWSTGNPEGPYWGKVGQSAEWKETGKGFRNFRLDSLYIGVLPVMMALLGIGLAYSRRKEETDSFRFAVIWLILALLAYLLALGKYSLLFKGFYHLPLVGNIRAPIKFLHNFQIAIGVLAAFGAHHLFARCEDLSSTWWKRLLIGSFCIAGALFFIMMLSAGSGAEQRFSEFGAGAQAIVKTMGRAWMYAGISAAALGILMLLAWRKPTMLKGQLPLIVLCSVVAADSAYLTSRYFKFVDVGALRRGNVVSRYLQTNQGAERIMFLEQGGVYNQWLAVDVRYHGLNVFNIWQMPRMPEEYKRYLGAVGQNQVRLWQLASVRYITAPAGILQSLNSDPNMARMLRPVLFYRFGMKDDQLMVLPIDAPAHARDQVLLEFNAHVPRMAFYSHWQSREQAEQLSVLFDQGFDPTKSVLVDVTGLPASGPAAPFTRVQSELDHQTARATIETDQPGILLFTQRYQPRWKVRVNGEPAEIIRSNYLCMGVYLEAGQNEVVFDCR